MGEIRWHGTLAASLSYAVLTLFCGLAFAVAPAAAKTYRVTKTGDLATGACTTNDCSLREAFRAANGHNGADVVELRRGKTYTLQQPGQGEDDGLSGDLDSKGRLTVRAIGNGSKRAVIDASGVDRALQMFAPSVFEAISIRDGAAIPGAAIAAAGGLRLVRCEVRANGDAASPAVGLLGGDLKVSRSSLGSNPGAALQQLGAGSIVIDRSKLKGNGYATEERGAGNVKAIRSRIENTVGPGLQEFDGGSLSIERSTVKLNGGQALVEFGSGDIGVSRSHVDRTQDQSIVEFDAGGISIERSSVDRGTGQAVVEFDTGGISIKRSSVDRVDDQAVVEFGAGGIQLLRSSVNDVNDQAVLDFDSGGVKLVRSRVNNAESNGVMNFGPGPGDTTIIRSTVNGSGDDGVYMGSGNTGTVRISRSRINRSVGDGVSNSGSGRLRIDRSSVSGGNNAGIYLSTARLQLTRSTIDANQGSGVYVSSAGRADIDASAITNNSIASSGGGVVVNGRASITRATIAGNEAVDYGGGVAAQGSDASVSLNGVTLARNRAGTDGSGAGGGLSVLDGATARVKNSLLALDTGQGGINSSCIGVFTSGGGNLRTDAGTLCDGFDKPGDAIRPNAKIGKLRSNGGPTKTVALKKGSPAIGRARNSSTKRDQRDFKRDNNPDAGAYEFGAKHAK